MREDRISRLFDSIKKIMYKVTYLIVSEDESYYEINNYLQFLNARKKLMKEKLFNYYRNNKKVN